EAPASATYTGGRVGQAIALDGNLGVILPQDDRFDRGVFTVETWVRRANSPRASQSPAGDGALFAGGRSSYSLTMGTDGRIFLSHVAIQSYYFPASITDLEWHHLCLVRNGPGYRIYVDGQPGGEVTVPGTVVTSGPFAIGSLSEGIDGQFYGFWGAMDELGFYARELGESEILALYEAGADGKCETSIPGSNCEPVPTGVTGWFPLDEDARNLVNPAVTGSPAGAAFVPGLVGGAAFFDGLNPGLILADDPKLKSQDFTVEAWIQRASLSHASQSSPANGSILAGGLDSPALAVAADGMVYFGIIGRVNYQSSGRIVDTGWHHVAVTKLSSEVVVYLDGDPVAAHNL
ncbi:MAG: LamG domain-containing protein, partial [Desulfobacterales bacterium]|nr:LamG domain-containing protein [Desulfobacterales bacterium]